LVILKPMVVYGHVWLTLGVEAGSVWVERKIEGSCGGSGGRYKSGLASTMMLLLGVEAQPQK
jgi:hypothetical protein